jgi:hypothetical protein
MKFLRCATALVTVTLLSELLSPLAATAQRQPSTLAQFSPNRIVNPGRPGGRRRGGGSRGGCPADSVLTALTHGENQSVQALGVTRTEETVGALTLHEQPTLWFYLPIALNSNSAATLTVKNDQGELLYSGNLAGETTTAGIVGVPLEIALSEGQDYEWFLALDCGGGEQDTVNGWIGRRTVDSAMIRTLIQADDRNRATLYGDEGFLQDSLSELATARLNNPQDGAIAQDWTALLTELGLAEVAPAPVLDCCQLVRAE